MPSLVPNDDSNLIDSKTFESLLIDTVTPRTNTQVSDSQGGYTDSWANGTTFLGRLSRLTASERMMQDKATSMATHKIYSLTSASASPEQRMVIGSRIFQVVGVLKPSNLDTDGHYEISVYEVDYDL